MTKTALVTGGSSGLGRALAEVLVRQGWQVIVDGRDVEALRKAAAAVGSVPVPGDVTTAGHRAALMDEVRSRGGRLDLLVNNAGALGPSPLPPVAELELEALREVYEANVLAPLALIRLALPPLRASLGAIVNVTSDAAVEGYPGWGGYGSSKAALEAISRVLAVEEPRVRVWWVDPGDMRTRMHQDAFPGEDISDRPDPATVVPDLLALLDARPPSGRVRLSDLSDLRDRRDLSQLGGIPLESVE